MSSCLQRCLVTLRKHSLKYTNTYYCLVCVYESCCYDMYVQAVIYMLSAYKTKFYLFLKLCASSTTHVHVCKYSDVSLLLLFVIGGQWCEWVHFSDLFG